MNRFRFAYVIDGQVRLTDTFVTGHTDPQKFAEVVASLPKDPPFDAAEVHVWADPNASTDTPADAVVKP